MATPITQSKTDEERDRLVAAVEQSIDPELLHVTGSSLDDGNSALVEKMEPHQQQQHSRMPTDNRNSLASGRSVVVGSVKNATIIGLGGGTTPQSPIVSGSFSHLFYVFFSIRNGNAGYEHPTWRAVIYSQNWRHYESTQPRDSTPPKSSIYNKN